MFKSEYIKMYAPYKRSITKKATLKNMNMYVPT